MEQLQKILADRALVTKGYVAVLLILLVLWLLEGICAGAGKKVKAFNNVAGILQMLRPPLVLLAIFGTVLTGCVWLTIPWYIAAAFALFALIIGVGYITCRR